MIVNTSRQVPAPSAAGWLIDLRDERGPAFVVLRQDEAAARDCLREHLVDLGVAAGADADELLAGAEVEHAAVIW